jgi:hypothetical protein
VLERSVDGSACGAAPRGLVAAPTARAVLDLGVQIALIVGAALLYFAVRGVTEGSEAVAVRNAEELLRLERALRLDVEAAVQRAILDHHVVVTLANWVYIWGHWPVITITLFWLYRHERPRYLLLTRAMFVSGGIGLIIFASYPVAPPRLMPDGVWVDTVTELSTSYRVLQPPALVNKYAALPSLHVGWNLLIGVVLFRAARGRPLRVAAAVLPVLMTAAVVATGNHYVLDAVLGALVALVGLAVAHQLTRDRRPRRDRTRPSRSSAAEVDQERLVVDDQPGHAPPDQPLRRVPVGDGPGQQHRATAAQVGGDVGGEEPLVHPVPVDPPSDGQPPQHPQLNPVPG